MLTESEMANRNDEDGDDDRKMLSFLSNFIFSNINKSESRVR